MVAFLARWLRPCFNQAAFVQTRYWSNYIDMEQKIFEETCCEHARDFANKCILHFFESMRTEIKLRRFNMPRGEEEGEGEADHLRGITDQEQVNKLLKTWYSGKPPLDVSQTIPRQPSGKEGACTSVPWGDTVNNRWAAAQKANVSRQTDV